MSGLAIDVSVTLHNALKRLDRPTVERLLNTAMRSGAMLIANEWKSIVPYRTGTYRRSIHVAGATELTPDFTFGDSLYSEMAQGSDPLIVRVGTNITAPPYPVFLEYGTSRMPPHPSAGPAFDATRDAALREVGEAFEELVAKELAK